MSRAADLTKGAAVRRSPVTTSLPMLYPSTLSYLLKASIVLVYSFKMLVDHEGMIRSMEPFKGKERSMLFWDQKTDVLERGQNRPNMVYIPAALRVLMQLSWLREELTL